MSWQIAPIVVPGRRRFSFLLAPIMLVIAVLALFPADAQAAIVPVAPQSGAQSGYESELRGGRPPYGRFVHRRNNRRNGPRYHYQNPSRQHLDDRQCCARYNRPSGQHQNHCYGDNRGRQQRYGDYRYGKGYMHDDTCKYDRDHYDTYSDYSNEDKGYNGNEEYDHGDTEEKGGVSSGEETDEEAGGIASSETTDDASASGASVDIDPIVQLSNSDELGPYLVDANGMTLYRFDRDTTDASFCTGDCAAAWPSLLVEADAELIAAEGVPGELGRIVRDDGSVQATYNGSPLYYFADDQQPGDVSGHGVDDVWHVVAP